MTMAGISQEEIGAGARACRPRTGKHEGSQDPLRYRPRGNRCRGVKAVPEITKEVGRVPESAAGGQETRQSPNELELSRFSSGCALPQRGTRPTSKTAVGRLPAAGRAIILATILYIHINVRDVSPYFAILYG